MPLLDIQRRGREIGRIRLGITVTGANGRKRPEKLSAFRFTMQSRRIADAVAGLLGGEVRPWESPSGPQWEVLTDATELPVAVPPGDAAVNQWYELWTGGGCVRRCDGITETLTQAPCLCPPAGPDRAAAAGAGEACKPTTRVNVMIPDLPDIGVFRVESHGFYAAVELGGAAELLAAAREAGVIIPAVLRLEQRQVKRIVGGKAQTRNFPVPVLEVVATLREVTQLHAGGGLAAALPAAPPRALEGAPARQLEGAPAPESVTGRADAPASAQACADRAIAAADRASVVDLGKVARARGWLDEHVQGPGEAFEPLGDLLMGRLAEIDRATRDGGEPR